MRHVRRRVRSLWRARKGMQSIWRARRGATAVEFALVGSVLMLVLFGVLSTGLLLWTEGGLQTAAMAAARCGALNSPLCSNVSQYAVTQAQNWVTSGIIGTGNVAVSANATTCNGASGTFEVVTITCPFWSDLPPPLSGITLKVKGCYPT